MNENFFFYSQKFYVSIFPRCVDLTDECRPYALLTFNGKYMCQIKIEINYLSVDAFKSKIMRLNCDGF